MNTWIRQHTGWAIAAMIAIAVAARPMSAQAQARPEAEQLFRDGKRLIKEGKLGEACAAFEASEKVEPNVATLMNLADCHEKNAQYASAWARFLNVDSRTRDDASKAAFNRTAKQRATALEARLSFLTINVPDESRVSGLVVTRDGVEVDPAQWNRAVPVDGGAHVVAGKAPGHESWSTTVQVAAEKDQRAVEVPRFKELPSLAAPDPGDARRGASTNAALGASRRASGAALSSRASPAQLRVDAAAPSPYTPRRKLALGIAAGSVAAVGTAIGFGLAARSARSDALATCTTSACTPAAAQAAQRTNDRARRYALVANVGYGVAGAAAIGATVLWLTSPHKPADAADAASLSLSPMLGPAGQGVVVSGGF
jgi:hypothetical protein